MDFRGQGPQALRAFSGDVIGTKTEHEFDPTHITQSVPPCL